MVRIEPRGDEGPRFYAGPGFVVPAATEVLKVLDRGYLNGWKKRVGEEEAHRVRSTAAAFGTRVHTLANKLVWEEGCRVPHDLEPYALALRTFFDAHIDIPLKTELPLLSERERVGGTLDLYARLKDGSFAVVDYKTSRQLSRGHGVQTAIYKLLLRDHGFPVDKRLVVRIKKEAPGGWYARFYPHHTEDIEAARAAITLWHWENKGLIEKELAA